MGDPGDQSIEISTLYDCSSHKCIANSVERLGPSA